MPRLTKRSGYENDMDANEITKQFEAIWLRDGARIIAESASVKQLIEFGFRQGYQRGFDAALPRTIRRESNAANAKLEVTSPTAARAL